MFSYLSSKIALQVSVLELFLQHETAWIVYDQHLSPVKDVLLHWVSLVPQLDPDGLKGTVPCGLFPLS